MTVPTGWTAEMDLRMRAIEDDSERYLEEATRDAAVGKLSGLVVPSGSAAGKVLWRSKSKGAAVEFNLSEPTKGKGVTVVPIEHTGTAVEVFPARGPKRKRKRKGKGKGKGN